MGHSSFKLKSKEGMVIIIDPFTVEKVGLPFAKDVADVLIVSHDHDDHNQKEMITGPVKRDKTFVIENEGEYEIGGVEINSSKTYHDKVEGVERGRNLLTTINMDGITVCHLGDLGHKLTESQVERIGDVDLLLIPVGGVFTVDPQEAVEIIKEIQPSLVVPMHYKVDGLTEMFAGLATLDQFKDKCKLPVMGEPVHKIKIEESGLPEDTQILVMNG